MSWAATIVAGATLTSAYISSEGSKSAAKKGAAGADEAVNESRRQFDLALDLARPGIEAGDTARNQLLRLLGLPESEISSGAGAGEAKPAAPSFGGFGRFGRRRGGFLGSEEVAEPAAEETVDPIDIIRNTPGFQFQTDQGTRALNANRSVGSSSGGSLIKDFTRFNQGVASSFYADYANRLAALAGTGQTAAQATGNQAVQSGAISGNALQNAGAFRASGVLGSNNAFGNAINDIARLIGQGGFGGGSNTGGINPGRAP